MMTAESLSFVHTLQILLPQQDLLTAADISVSGLTLDSRSLRAGDLFIAVAGTQQDGRQYIQAAIEGGAVAVLADADDEYQGIRWINAVPVIAIEQLGQQVSAIASHFYSAPSSRLRVTGVTGTNGKTTCTLLLSQLFALIEQRAAVLGTIGYGCLDKNAVAPLDQQIAALQHTGLTTPDAINVQRILALLADDMPAGTLAMEVSSHSLVQGRVAAVDFHCAVFTNLTPDHLDYHGDMITYGNAKASLLTAADLRVAVLNADDEWASALVAKVPAGVQCLRYSVADTTADIFAKDVHASAAGTHATVITPWGEGALHTQLVGQFNLSNVLAVITAACAQGASFAEVLAVLPLLQPAPGRMQRVALDQPRQAISVIVDYAHTPDALENTLNALREHQPSNIWTVFGCGGDRDKTKRPLMGRIAERLSDYIIVTNDNPRTEEPSAIAADILRGMHNSRACLVIADRAQAIDLAVQQAKEGDVVLIAGKGHEDYQIFADQTLPFSDIKQARLSLQRRQARLEASDSGVQS